MLIWTFVNKFLLKRLFSCLLGGLLGAALLRHALRSRESTSLDLAQVVLPGPSGVVTPEPAHQPCTVSALG